MCIIKESINTLGKKIKQLSLSFDKQTIKRKRKVFFKDCLLHMCNYVYNKRSHEITLDHLKNLSLINDVSITSIKKKINDYGHESFSKLNDELLKISYPKYDKTRIIAVDVSRLSLPLNFKEHGFSPSKNKNYTKGFLSVLFDVDKQIPISSILSKTHDERCDFRKQLKFINEKDIVVGDRGYPSWNMLKDLQNKKINFVFRVSKNWSVNELCDDFIDYDYDENDEYYDYHHDITNNDIDVRIYKNICDKHIFFDEIVNIEHKNKTYNFRIIKYKINDNDYCIVTNMFNVDNNLIQYIYYKRWEIETCFRDMKHTLSLHYPLTLTLNSLLTNIEIHKFLLVVSSYFRNILKSKLKPEYKLNTKMSLNKTIDIMYDLLNGYLTKNKLLKLYKIIKDLLNHTIKYKYNHKDYKNRQVINKWCIKAQQIT